MNVHASLLPLLQDELRRLLPALREIAERLQAAAEPMAEAQWHRRIEGFRGAASVFAGTRLPAFIDWLQRAWSEPGERAQTVQRIRVALDLLSVLADAAAEPGLAQLQELLVPSGPSTLPPPTLVEPAQSAVDPRLRALFIGEVEDKTAGMTRQLVQLEQRPDALELIAPLMRAAHSIKGAARAVRNDAAVKLAHALEDRLSAAQRRERALDRGLIDLALRSLDQLRALAHGETAALQASTADLIAALRQPPAEAPPAATADPAAATAAEPAAPAAAGDYIDAEDAEPVLRVRASLVGRLIDLASSGMVESRRLAPFAQRQQRLRRTVTDIGRQLDALHHHLGAPGPQTPLGAELGAMRQALLDARHELSDWLQQFGEYERDATELTERLYTTAASTRMRPFADVAAHYPRTARDLARQLDRNVRLQIVGEHVAVDRDVLERLDAPLNHLLRNAVDHGIEAPDVRRAAGKPEDGTIRIHASYRAGMLAIDVTDDGRGIDFEQVRAKLVDSGRLEPDAAAALDHDALKDFLFSAGFSTREAVSEISGRGVGLDVVRQMVRQLEGSVRIDSEPGAGTTFHLVVPISRAVTRALVVNIASELYAFPLLRLQRIQRIARAQLFDRDGAVYADINGVNVGLVPLAEQLELGRTQPPAEHVDAVIIAREGRTIGFVVDAVVGEFDLASRPLDPRLGRVADIAAVAVLPDGSPVVLIDVDDLMRGALDLRRAAVVGSFAETASAAPRQRVLVVDDSISVRELERQILAAHGYAVDVAVDGADAWSRLRSATYDLVVTDVDMPRMDGIELTRSIKQDARLRSVPVVIVSYRDRPEDRARGLDARADAYLTKGDFQEDRLLHTVVELIGPAQADAR